MTSETLLELELACTKQLTTRFQRSMICLATDLGVREPILFTSSDTAAGFECGMGAAVPVLIVLQRFRTVVNITAWVA